MKEVPMRNLAIATAAAALIATALPASAQTGAATQARDDATEQRAVEENPDRRICVSVELTGSRMVRRVCRTAREWEARGGLESVR
jgi:hypothetical protein